jgi:hypothetical protein
MLVSDKLIELFLAALDEEKRLGTTDTAGRVVFAAGAYGRLKERLAIFQLAYSNVERRNNQSLP